jgi:hypothetical protein
LLKEERILRGEFSGLIYCSIKLVCKRIKVLEGIRRGNTWKEYENNQQDAPYSLIYYSKSALHVSGDVFAHQQKHLTVFTVSGSVHTSCCWQQPVATWVNTTRYCKYSQVLLLMGENIA